VAKTATGNPRKVDAKMPMMAMNVRRIRTTTPARA
jgi:hypothetical protein